MPKLFSEYKLEDWLRLRPLLHALKQRRYRAIDVAHSLQPPRKGDLNELVSTVRNKRLLVTIAYGDAVATAWQTALVRGFVPNATHLIADNTTDTVAADLIEEAALRNGAAYIRLPSILWRRAITSRSHGLALNWVWRNLIKPGEPTSFGFLDHDIFPTRPDNPFEPLDFQPCYGHVRTAGPRWFLWAGFCMFKFSAVRDLSLDFGQDWFAGLDTGGGNWTPLYQGLQQQNLKCIPYQEFYYAHGFNTTEAQMQWLGSWLHEVGVRRDEQLKKDKRAALTKLLDEPLLNAGKMARFATNER